MVRHIQADRFGDTSALRVAESDLHDLRRGRRAPAARAAFF